MKVILQVLLLIFYFASSVVVTQERTSVLVREVKHVIDRDAGTQVSSGYYQRTPFPRYREAKKAGSNLDLRPAGAVDFSPRVAELEFSPFATPRRLSVAVRVGPPRAPPTQS